MQYLDFLAPTLSFDHEAYYSSRCYCVVTKYTDYITYPLSLCFIFLFFNLHLVGSWMLESAPCSSTVPAERAEVTFHLSLDELTDKMMVENLSSVCLEYFRY